MRALAPSLILFLMASFCRGNDLERRVQHLEEQLANLESLVVNIVEKEIVGQYGLVKRCPIPRVQHGTVTCNKDEEAPNNDFRVAGTFCSAECEEGYFTTPGVTCAKDGSSWSGELRCDTLKELLVVSGGTDTDKSVEVINFHKNSTGCDLSIPNLRGGPHNEVHMMHNMFLNPTDRSGRPQLELWVCNGLSRSDMADCEYWKPGESNWTLHSYPHRGNIVIWNTNNYKYEIPSNSKGGRYGASSFTWGGSNYMVGGMINIGNQHKSSNDVKFYHEHSNSYRSSWIEAKNFSMDTNRTLFCIAQLNMSTPSFVAIGGHSGGVPSIEKSVEYLEGDRRIPWMTTRRKGHSCVGIGGDQEKIVVSGGSDKSHRSGKNALKTAEVFNGERWEMVGDMNQARFGHALVNIGGRVIAVGGKEWNPDKPLKNAEEFDPNTKTWSPIGDIMKIPRANFGYVKVPYTLIPGCKVY